MKSYTAFRRRGPLWWYGDLANLGLGARLYYSRLLRGWRLEAHAGPFIAGVDLNWFRRAAARRRHSRALERALKETTAP